MRSHATHTEGTFCSVETDGVLIFRHPIYAYLNFFWRRARRAVTWSSEREPLGQEEVDLVEVEGQLEVAFLGQDPEPPRALSML